MAKFTEAKDKKIAKAYLKGQSVRSLSEDHDCSRYAIYAALDRQDARKSSKKKITKSEPKKIKKPEVKKAKPSPKPKVKKLVKQELSAKQRNRILSMQIIKLFRLKKIGAKKIARALKIPVQHVVRVLRHNKLIK